MYTKFGDNQRKWDRHTDRLFKIVLGLWEANKHTKKLRSIGENNKTECSRHNTFGSEYKIVEVKVSMGWIFTSEW